MLTLEDGTRFILGKDELKETAEHGRRFYDINDEPDDQSYGYVDHLYEPGLKLRKIVDVNGNEVELTRDGLFHKDGPAIRFTRDGLERITSATDASGQVVLEYGYDNHGDLASVTRLVEGATATQPARKVTTTYTYKKTGSASTHIIEKITSPGNKTPLINEYDDKGRLLSSTDAFGKQIIYTHGVDQTPRTRQEIVEDRRGGQTVYEYDERGNVLLLVNPAGEKTRYEYLDQTNPTLATSETTAADTAHALTKTYTYDDKGFRIKEEYTVDGKLTRTEWGYVDTVKGEHALAFMIGPDGTRTEHTYDAVSGLRTLTVTKGTDLAITSRTTYEYDSRGNPTKVLQWIMNATGEWVAYAANVSIYDPAGRVVESRQEKADGTWLSKSTNSYDANGNLRSSTQWSKDATGTWAPYATTDNAYDLQNRLVETRSPAVSGQRAVTKTRLQR